MREEPTYCGDFPESFLMAWLANRRADQTVVCAYCDLPVMSVELKHEDEYQGKLETVI